MRILSVKSVLFVMTTTPLIKAIQVSVGVTEVKIKTGIVAYASTDATPSLKICDGLSACCDTSGLDNYGNDRPSGQVDVYEAEWQLGNCTEENLDPSGNWT